MNVYLLVVGKNIRKKTCFLVENAGDLTSQGGEFWGLMISWEKTYPRFAKNKFLLKSGGWEKDNVSVLDLYKVMFLLLYILYPGKSNHHFGEYFLVLSSQGSNKQRSKSNDNARTAFFQECRLGTGYGTVARFVQNPSF